MKLNVIIHKTANGKQDYIQIMSEDMFTVNIVLISEEVVVEDSRND